MTEEEESNNTYARGTVVSLYSELYPIKESNYVHNHDFTQLEEPYMKLT